MDWHRQSDKIGSRHIVRGKPAVGLRDWNNADDWLVPYEDLYTRDVSVAISCGGSIVYIDTKLGFFLTFMLYLIIRNNKI